MNYQIPFLLALILASLLWGTVNAEVWVTFTTENNARTLDSSKGGRKGGGGWAGSASAVSHHGRRRQKCIVMNKVVLSESAKS